MIVKRRKNVVTARQLTTDEMVTINGKTVQGRVGQYVVVDDDEKMLLDSPDFDELYEVVAKKNPMEPPPMENPAVANPPVTNPQIIVPRP